MEKKNQMANENMGMYRLSGMSNIEAEKDQWSRRRKVKVKERVYRCNECDVEIKFDDNIRSPNGKVIPLELAGTPHCCRVKEERLLYKMQDYIDRLELKYYKVNLIVEENDGGG